MDLNATEKTHTRNQHFGVVNLSIHYTLAAGLAEQLGDKVEMAVAAAASMLGSSNNQIVIDGAVIRMEKHWHSRHWHPETSSFDEPEPAVSIHLSNDLEGYTTYSVDWDWF
jgi:hypothetical protein